MSRFVKRPLLLILVLTTLILLLVQAPTAATHHVQAEHDPPQEAFENEPLDLEISVSSTCVVPVGGFCEEVYVYLTYYFFDDDGETRAFTTGETLPQWGGIARFTIPGDLVGKPEVRYSFRIVQWANCGVPSVGPLQCHFTGGVSPEYTIPVA